MATFLTQESSAGAERLSASVASETCCGNNRRRAMDRLWRLLAIAAACFTVIAASEVRAEAQIGAVRQPEYKCAIGQLATGAEHQLIYSEPVYAEETVLTGAK